MMSKKTVKKKNFNEFLNLMKRTFKIKMLSDKQKLREFITMSTQESYVEE